MQVPIAVFSLCLLIALAVPSWGASTKKSPPTVPQQVTKPIIPSAPIKAGNYTRDPRKPMEMRQYLKELKQKQQEAAANRAAARAKQAAPDTAAPLQTEGGTK
jgi:hypothetical protein